ncbi:peptidase S8/S53 domain-containing protein [Tricladium varicosporioides]|nr:peptidase S8/S53 domain-containing protein [Hymenoscyphus varicosporioides]
MMHLKTKAFALGLQILPSIAKVLESLSALPRGWIEIATPESHSIIKLSIVLAKQNIDQLESRLLEVSTPGNAEYGKYFDAEIANRLFAPDANASGSVEFWLRNQGIQNITGDGYRLTFQTTVENANKLLNTSFRIYQQTDNGISNMRTTQYSVPNDLVKFIDLITPTTYFGVPKSTQRKGPSIIPRLERKEVGFRNQTYKVCSKDDPYQVITPDCQKELYNIGNYTPEFNSGSMAGFVTFNDMFTLYDDLFKFEELLNITKQNITTITINGASNNQTQGGYHSEGNLDADILVGISHPLPVMEFNVKLYPDGLNMTEGDYWNELFSYFHTQPNWKLPQVISISYYSDEEDIPPRYAQYICNLIGILGLRGITMMGCSGDRGLGYPCRSKSGELKFNTVFPSSCPYYTSVGATMHVPEEGFYISSGGFSSYFPAPRYQQKAVNNYLDEQVKKEDRELYGKYANFSGRAFPDIALMGLNAATVNRGYYGGGSGTSASAPMLAGIIALINDARLQAGKGPLGFINPLIYEYGSTVFNDITKGLSYGCGQLDRSGNLSSLPLMSWNCTVGWDPVTGIGTPDFEKLKEIALGL